MSSKFYTTNSKPLLAIYSALIRSLFRYSMLPYIISNKKIKKYIQTLQNKVLCTIFKINKLTYNKILHSLANVDLIDKRLEKQAKNYLTRACRHNETINNLITKHSTASINTKTKIKSILNFLL